MPDRECKVTGVTAPPWKFDPLTTQRLVLRAPRAGDVDDLHALQSDPEVVRYQLFEPRSRDEVAARLPELTAATTLAVDGDFIQPAMELTLPDGSTTVIGTMYFVLKSVENAAAEIGWALRREHQGRGYAFEAAVALGVRLAGALPEKVAAIDRYALHVGAGFQVLNDLKDWAGDLENDRRAAGDLMGGRPTVLWAPERMSSWATLRPKTNPEQAALRSNAPAFLAPTRLATRQADAGHSISGVIVARMMRSRSVALRCAAASALRSALADIVAVDSPFSLSTI